MSDQPVEDLTGEGGQPSAQIPPEDAQAWRSAGHGTVVWTCDDVDELPPGVVALDRVGDVWRLRPDGDWQSSRGNLLRTLLALPVVVLANPEVRAYEDYVAAAIEARNAPRPVLRRRDAARARTAVAAARNAEETSR